MATPLAPMDNALTMSVPRRKPESISTGMVPDAAMISGRLSMVERPDSSARPPWLETMMASIPASAAILEFPRAGIVVACRPLPFVERFQAHRGFLVAGAPAIARDGARDRALPLHALDMVL